MKNIVSFNKILEEVKRFIDINDEQEYACSGVRLNGKGAFVREYKFGHQIKKKYVQHTLKEGDVVFSTLFAGKGAFAIASKEVDGSILSEKFPTYLIKDERIESKYLEWFFRSGQLARIAEKQVTGMAAFSLSHLSKKKFLAMGMPVPSRKRQLEVVKICEEAQAETNRCMHYLRENSSLLDALMGRFAEHLFAKLEVCSLSDIGEYVLRNAEIDPSRVYKQVTVAMNNKGLRLRRECRGSEIKSAGQCYVEEGDLLFSRIDIRNGAIGFVSKELEGAVVTKDFPVFKLENNSQISREYLDFVFLTPYFKEQAINCSRGTTGRKKLKRDYFLDFKVPWPKIQVQHKLVDILKKKRYEINQLFRFNLEQHSLVERQFQAIIEREFAVDSGLD